MMMVIMKNSVKNRQQYRILDVAVEKEDDLNVVVGVDGDGGVDDDDDDDSIKNLKNYAVIVKTVVVVVDGNNRLQF